MQLSTLLCGTLAAFATAGVVRGPKTVPQPQGLGLESAEELLALVRPNLPGLDALIVVLRSLKEDTTWKVDYTDKAHGNVVLTELGEQLCLTAQKTYNEYGDSWLAFLDKVVFDSPCHGGRLHFTREEYVDMVRLHIGDGH